jgi:hypothetical protein
MSNIGFSNPAISINNQAVAIKPNSFKYKVGKTKKVVRSVSTGGGGTTSIHTEDATSAVGEFQFEVAVTDDNRVAVSNWQDNIGANVCTATQAGVIPVVGVNMSETDDPEWNASSDGWVAIKFMGDVLQEA